MLCLQVDPLARHPSSQDLLEMYRGLQATEKDVLQVCLGRPLLYLWLWLLSCMLLSLACTTSGAESEVMHAATGVGATSY